MMNNQQEIPDGLIGTFLRARWEGFDAFDSGTMKSDIAEYFSLRFCSSEGSYSVQKPATAAMRSIAGNISRKNEDFAPRRGALQQDGQELSCSAQTPEK